VARAKAMTVLSHPNVITLFDAGEHEFRVYLAFEHLEGQSLRKEMAGGHLGVRRATQTAVQVADAIAAAHALGFFHGGLSPDTISITARGHAKVPAFELAAHAGFSADGSLHDYHAPEELAGHSPDDRSDVYSVGAILYEMLTGRRPNPKGSARPSEANRHVPPELDELAIRAVSPHPNVRPQTVAVLAGELRAVVAQLEAKGVADEPEHPHPGATSASRRWPALAALAVLVVALWWLWSSTTP
jgi:serine/threonine-protein kinase